MKSLKTFEFAAPVGSTASDYNWDKMLDGGIYQLTEGEDFTCKAATFRSLASSRAKKLGKKVKINKVEGGLVMQAEVDPNYVPPTTTAAPVAPPAAPVAPKAAAQVTPAPKPTPKPVGRK